MLEMFRSVLKDGAIASEVIASYSSNRITQLLLCTSAKLVLCRDQFDRGSRQVKRDQVDLLTVDYDITLCWRIPKKIYHLKEVNFLRIRTLMKHIVLKCFVNTNWLNYSMHFLWLMLHTSWLWCVSFLIEYYVDNNT